MARARTAVLISGRGTNLQSLLDAASAPDYPAEIALVISNRPDAEGLSRARRAGAPTLTIDHREFGRGEAGRAAFDAALDAALKAAKIELVCLAGFMRLLTPGFVAKWEGRLLNIHPSLLPAFKGLDVHERMIAAGVKIAGCTVHFVTAEMDAGPILGQAAVPVLPGDDAARLAARILEQEHRLYPACLRLVAEGRARLGAGSIAALDVAPPAGAALLNPPA
ncbi:phosphoribosylglycinamide formyltransferase [Amphiplicatus metriothermophilus]|uniref:Phosphoribosylglycinamide formyltransferase n=1 Tax=Amphiplicatus metriothermophilus TaxID=1519374 RepID=A0A239PVG2_9PROT|nr:phosphoribosylglycinamide formyltransferase [Amphiplicatus metriothermophilus]MBB5519596.1 phosphoribosylglycinamide formyltransferase-1 [Amphiplicatus metriothermophilus]SNT74160.1 phosphoribosylglycinamide formyltransferase-1 [Amphiplicatus metriothermophilus]